MSVYRSDTYCQLVKILTTIRKDFSVIPDSQIPLALYQETARALSVCIVWCRGAGDDDKLPKVNMANICDVSHTELLRQCLELPDNSQTNIVNYVYEYDSLVTLVHADNSRSLYTAMCEAQVVAKSVATLNATWNIDPAEGMDILRTAIIELWQLVLRISIKLKDGKLVDEILASNGLFALERLSLEVPSTNLDLGESAQSTSGLWLDIHVPLF